MSQVPQRDWQKVLSDPKIEETLRSDIDKAMKIIHSSVINGERYKQIHHRSQPDFKDIGQKIAAMTINTFFSKIWMNKDLLKRPDVIKKFQDLDYFGSWKFYLNEDEWMEVHLVH